MATVPDIARQVDAQDRPLSSPNRTVTGNPLGSVTPLYRGELVADTATGTVYAALGTSNTSWVVATLRV